MSEKKLWLSGLKTTKTMRKKMTMKVKICKSEKTLWLSGQKTMVKWIKNYG